MKLPVGVKALLIAILVTIPANIFFWSPIPIIPMIVFWLTLAIAWEYLTKKEKRKK